MLSLLAQHAASPTPLKRGIRNRKTLIGRAQWKASRSLAFINDPLTQPNHLQAGEFRTMPTLANPSELCFT
jgi:hypothetical protein